MLSYDCFTLVSRQVVVEKYTCTYQFIGVGLHGTVCVAKQPELSEVVSEVVVLDVRHTADGAEVIGEVTVVQIVQHTCSNTEQ